MENACQTLIKPLIMAILGSHLMLYNKLQKPQLHPMGVLP